MYKLLLFLLAALVLEAMGVVYLSKGLKEIGEPRALTPSEIGRVTLQGLANGSLLAGIAMETAFFVMLMILLKRHDVSLIWPLTSLGFVLTALAAKFIRHEEVSLLRWSGVLLIVSGAALVGWSESIKKSEANKIPVSTQTPQ
jgi:undecaprenyl phosphate-alpha-L-ara4N flippase subunit ArnE